MPQPPSKPRDDGAPATDPKAAPIATPPAANPPAPVPPPTPPADKLTPPDAAQDGDGQHPPADGPQAHHPPAPPDAVQDGDGQGPPDSAPTVIDNDDDDDGPAPRKRQAVILLPMGDDGEPDMLGSRLDVVGIETNYQDCAKVRVSGSARAISDLREKSEEHFRQAWNGR